MMAKLCLTASHGYPSGSGLLLHQDHNMLVKDCRPYLPSMQAGQEMTRPDSFRLKPHQHDETQNRITGIELASHFDSSIGEPVLIDVKGAWPNVLPSAGIDEQCIRHDRMMQFFKSRWDEFEARELDLHEVSELMGLRTLHLAIDLDAWSPPRSMKGESDFMNPLVDFVGDMARGSEITIHPDGQLLLSATGTEIKDILPIVVEFYLANNSTAGRTQSLIPHFNRLDTYEAEFSSLNVQDVAVAPFNSPEKVKAKPLCKRRSGRRGVCREEDLYKRNYFHAWESLLSLMMNKKHNDGKAAILWLKKSGPELPELLTQFSAGIAGTGLGVIFSVVCKLACGRVPLTGSKLLSTGLGFGLVWLSWAVNKLRDTIIHISRNSSKGLKDEEVTRTVDKSLNDIYFRAATLLVTAVLSVA